MRMSLIRLPSSALVEVAGRDLLYHAAEGPVDSLDHPPGGGPGPAVGVQVWALVAPGTGGASAPT